MNYGVIAGRYATALLKYVTDTGHGEAVYAQVKALLSDPDAAPKPLHPDLEAFFGLVDRNGRMPLASRILHRFVRLYDERNHIHVAHLKTAVDSPALQEKLRAFVSQTVGGTVEFQSEVDPSLIGGFVLEVDDCRLDASVSHQLAETRRQLMEKNKRIV